MSTQPTLGAMRAAALIHPYTIGRTGAPSTVTQLAQDIDRETGAPDMMRALKDILRETVANRPSAARLLYIQNVAGNAIAEAGDRA